MPREPQAVYQELLVRRCQAGETAALSELVRTWEQRLRYYIRRLVPSEADAWDVLQQTWMQVFRSITRLRDAAALRAWLYALARHTAATHYRPELLRRDRTEPDMDPAELPVDDERPHLELAEAVHTALTRLSLAHREVLTLHFLEAMSVAEIAAVVDAPPGTVKSRLYYAKRALRAALEQERVS